MPRDPRVDAYIARSAEFARPILEEIRERVHAACPAVEEAIKWGMPSFQYHDSILAGMAAFKRHVSFGFWKHRELMGDAERDGMGSYGRMASLKDLPPKRAMLADIRHAAKLNEAAATSAIPQKARAARPAPDMPADLMAALRTNAAAEATFDAFPPSARRDYIDWIVEAKREDSRAKRLAQAVEWMAEGRRRNWKYERG